MRYYIYVQMVTFKLSIYKLIKNSLIFALLGIKRNILAFLGIAVFILLEFLFIFAFGGVLISFAIALPLLLFFSSAAYMKVYAAYFKLEELIIEPYYAEHPEERPSNDYEDEEDEEVELRTREEQEHCQDSVQCRAEGCRPSRYPAPHKCRKNV